MTGYVLVSTFNMIGIQTYKPIEYHNYYILLTLSLPEVINIKLLPTISIHYSGKQVMRIFKLIG